VARENTNHPSACFVVLAATMALGCASAPPPSDAPSASASPVASKPAPPVADRAVTISVVGTNDLHGRIDALPTFGGYLANLRRKRAADGGAVLLLDGGDMFQGTLESNLGEGAAVVSAYAALGYAAVAIGNHEFDFGPAGPAPTPTSPSDDPRGALKARAQSAPFPFVCSNILEAASKKRVEWPNVPSSVLLELAGVKVGLIGATTEETPRTTIRANVADLAMAPMAQTIASEAAALRARGAALVVVVAHEGGRCERFTGDVEADGCDQKSEMFKVVRALPKGAVDVFVGGHTHAAVAHRLADVAMIESYSYGKAFGRVDVTLEGQPRRPVAARIWPPQNICTRGEGASCEADAYEGAPVVADERVRRAIQPHVESARQKRAERVGVRLASTIRRAYGEESALGNLFADLVRDAVPSKTTIGLMNGGGLRADLPEGDLTFGALYEAFPFDNKLAVAKIRGSELRALFKHHLAGSGGILSISGVTMAARCRGAEVQVELRKADGRALADNEQVQLVASDFMLTGGDDFWGPVTPPSIEVKDTLVRDALVAQLAARRTVRDADLIDAKRPRLGLPGKRPVRCQP